MASSAEDHVVDRGGLRLVRRARVHLDDGLGWYATSKRPSAFAGPWLKPIRPAMAATASVPPRLADITSASTVGSESSPRPFAIWLGIGNCTEPAISLRKPSMSSTVAAIPPV